MPSHSTRGRPEPVLKAGRTESGTNDSYGVLEEWPPIPKQSTADRFPNFISRPAPAARPTEFIIPAVPASRAQSQYRRALSVPLYYAVRTETRPTIKTFSTTRMQFVVLGGHLNLVVIEQVLKYKWYYLDCWDTGGTDVLQFKVRTVPSSRYPR